MFDDPDKGKDALRKATEKAVPRERKRVAKKPDTPGGEPPKKPPPRKRNGGGDDPPPERGSPYSVPPGCPVQALGIDGQTCLFLDASHQFTRMEPRQFAGQGLAMLFGQKQDWLDEAWPRFNRQGERAGLNKENASRSLMQACASKGAYDSDNKIRGVGTWGDDYGRLIWHLGDTVLVTEQSGATTYAPLGTLGDYIYPQGAPQIRPDRGDPSGLLPRFYELLQRWAWKRGELDARLLLGWFGCALMGGALLWRPMMWLTGGSGTGKSTLHDGVINPVLGGHMSVVQCAEATVAGLYQSLRNRSTPVVFDELEPERGTEAKVKQAIGLARISASGGRVLRGAPDGTPREFTARAAFLFSSIHVPRLEPQDALRIALLDLQNLGTRREPVLDRADMTNVGRAMRRRLVDRWAAWPARLARFREALRMANYSARIADTWGSLLAMADHLMAPTDDVSDLHGDEIIAWVDALRPYLDELVVAAGSDYAGLLQALMTTSVDPAQKGQRWPLSTLFSIVSGRMTVDDSEADGMNRERAAAALETLGMRLVHVVPPEVEGEDPTSEAAKEPPAKILAVAFALQHTEINKLLRETKWATGIYSQTLLRVPGAWRAQQRMARYRPWCVMVPLDVILPRDSGQPADLFGGA